MFNPFYILKENLPLGKWKNKHTNHWIYKTESGIGLVYSFEESNVFYTIIMNEDKILDSTHTWQRLENAKFYIEERLNGNQTS